ncbi:valyl-tRNA synthetase, mitochondrial [Anticarsia gemmatalis]|uniref:valyl-tRNA synthetase, mitochondrial n=1 Tax=Anticarsia gemmatalis TaxID=129554 RepID=UPI003F76F7A0
MMHLRKYKVPCLNIHRSLASKTTRIASGAKMPAAAYQPQNVEKNKYSEWEKQNLFKADNKSSKPRFSMVLPPPNVTGKLHLGHALACTVQDVIVRHKRSTGHNVLWLPGTDHAGIATQGVVEKYLTKKGVNRHDIGREEFVKEVWKWKEKHGDTICDQLRTLGCSLDWSRQVFTMDERHTQAVNTAFIELFQKGLIYRKKALVNWCNALQSTVSDIEVENVTINGPTDVKVPGYERPIKFGQIYNFSYKLYDSEEEIVVSTTMPETMLGDTAIAVHPEDKRYTHLKGKTAIHPFRNTTIPIIFDTFVDMEFGTGAVKITPAHSKIDYEIAKHHNIPLLQVIDENGCIKNSEQFNNMKRYDCRPTIVQRLDEMGLMKEVSPHQMALPTCSRTGDVIDHLPKEQWFLSCTKLNKKAAELVQNGQLKIEPEKFVKNWLDWTGDDRDWCISRQLWWGHQIPAYKCKEDKNIVWVAATDEVSAKIEASKYLRTLPDSIEVERDTDVLDTWFSSGIYPFAVLGWPESKVDYRQFYPLNLMATGHDILGFWVHRMVILGLELTGQLPFKNVLLHGIICDNKGAKMSKSRGNVIDPIDVINGISLEGLREKSKEMHKSGILSKDELDKALAYHKANFSTTKGIPECGVDALRFTLLSQDIKSHFVNFDVAICHSNKLFCNKIWQSINYMNLSFAKLKQLDEEISRKDLTYFDRWMLSRLANMVEKVDTSMETHEFHLATKALRSLIYNEFCDVYLEATKPGFEHTNPKIGYAHAHTLSTVLNVSLRCLSPFMIYLTEELIPKIPGFETNIIHHFEDSTKQYFDFPKPDDFEIWKDGEVEQKIDRILNCIFLVRELKGLYNISNKLRPVVHIKTTEDTLITDVNENKTIILNLTRCSDIQFKNIPNRNIIKGVLDKNTEIIIELIGDDAEKAILAARSKLEKRIKKLEDVLTRLQAKLSSSSYQMNVSEYTQMSDREILQSKRKELQELQRLI